jgi:hypothetical protein
MRVVSPETLKEQNTGKSRCLWKIHRFSFGKKELFKTISKVLYCDYFSKKSSHKRIKSISFQFCETPVKEILTYG